MALLSVKSVNRPFVLSCWLFFDHMADAAWTFKVNELILVNFKNLSYITESLQHSKHYNLCLLINKLKR